MVNGIKINNIRYIILAVADITTIMYWFYGVFIVIGTSGSDKEICDTYQYCPTFTTLIPAFTATNKTILVYQVDINSPKYNFLKAHVNSTGKAVSNRKNWLPIPHPQRRRREGGREKQSSCINFKE